MKQEILIYHALGLLAGYVLDLIIGDPHNMPHPIRLIGSWILFLEKKIYKDSRWRGLLLVVSVIASAVLVTGSVVVLGYYINPIAGCLVEAVFTFYFLATKSLKDESGNVVDALEKKGIIEARKSLSMIVGRDTVNLSEEEVLKATVETVAENSSDGVVAPLIYLAIGGPVLGVVYKAVNTMDSMVGYHNDRYENFGYFAARLDDVLNFIPSRVCGLLIICTAFLLKDFNGKAAFRIWIRDRKNHKSPNSAQSEAAFAGAMGLKLAGPSYYFGKLVDKPFIGDAVNKIDRSYVKKSHRLLYGTSLICEIICTVAIFIIIKLNMIFL